MIETHGARIKRIRRARRLKQVELSRLAGLSKGYLCNIEKGRARPTVQALEKISSALDIAFVIDGAPLETGDSDDSSTGNRS